jgi:hypothetical protein
VADDHWPVGGVDRAERRRQLIIERGGGRPVVDAGELQRDRSVTRPAECGCDTVPDRCGQPQTGDEDDVHDRTIGTVSGRGGRSGPAGERDRVPHPRRSAVIVEPGLIRRIESSSARVTMATAAAFDRAVGGRVHAVAFADGTLAALGPGRYVNRAVGVSLDDLDDDQFDEIESFLTAAGVPPSLEVASWAPSTLLVRLAERRILGLVVPQRVRGGARGPAPGG